MSVEQFPINGVIVDVTSPQFNVRRDTDNVKPYKYEEFPKMLYSEAFDPAVERRRAQIAAHNRTLRDPLQCRQIPDRVRLTKVVGNRSEEASFVAQGYTTSPPAPLDIDEFAAIDTAFLSESERKQRESLGLKGDAKPALSVETIIALNLLSKDELGKRAKDEYGISVAPDATKIQIITAIQESAK